MTTTKDLDPAIALNFKIHEMAWPDDPKLQHAMLDAPFKFGDCPMDCLQGILNLARNASTILRAPQFPLIPATVPVIAIGSGPSLAFHVERLRQLQHKCLLIASLSAVRGLREAGIEPHVTTPLERTEDVMDWMPPCGDTMRFCGAPIVARPVLDCFREHYYQPDNNALSLWGSLPSDRVIYFGSSTGTLGISLACSITKGPIYLVGHDLAYDNGRSHWGPAQSAPVIHEGFAMGNNGEKLSSTWLWLRHLTMIEEFALQHGRMFNVNAVDKRGALIPNTHAGDLPDPASLPDFELPYSAPQPERLARWQSLAVQLPKSCRQAIRQFENAACHDDLDIARAVKGANGSLLSYLLASVYVQLSYETVTRVISEKNAFLWGKEALVNVLRGSLGVMDEIASHGVKHVS